jgi:hypothetical protein
MRRVPRFAFRAAAAFLVLIVLYGLLLLFPEPLFAYRVEEGPFVVYSRKPLPHALVARNLRDAEARLRHSEIHRGDLRHRVFVTGSKSLYRLRNGPYSGAIARNVDLGNAILLPDLNHEAARVVHFDGRSAPLDEILAHEATHTFVQERLGAVRALCLPFWKKEGYAQYVGLDFFPLAAGTRALEGPEKHPSLPGGGPVPRHYLEAAVVWAHRMQIEAETFDEVMARNEPFAELLRDALSAARSAP